MTAPLQAGYLPPGLALNVRRVLRTYEAHGQSLDVALPHLDAADLHTLAGHVRNQAQEHLAALPVMDIVDIVDRCIARMLDPADPDRQAMEPALATVSGFDPEMLRLGLNASLKTFRRPQLLRLLSEDLGDPNVLDRFMPRPRGAWSRCYGPELLGLVWAGNVPALPLWTLVAGLLSKAGTVGKMSTAEPLFAGWFCRTLAREAPALQGVAAAVWWPGGEDESEQVLAGQADVLLAYGGDRSLQAWHNRLPAHVRFLPHGHRISIGVVSAPSLDVRQAPILARLAARDLMQWDQQGCYSPQVFYVERGGPVSPQDFAALIAAELQALHYRFPRQTLGLEERNNLARWRQTLERQEQQGKPVRLVGAAHAHWALAYMDGPAPLFPSTGYRSACVVAVDSLDHVLTGLAPHRRHLQSAGLAAPPELLFHWAPRLAQAGFTRLCALGSMARPEAGWHHDGRFSLLDLLRVVDLELSAETLAETLATYRD